MERPRAIRIDLSLSTSIDYLMPDPNWRLWQYYTFQYFSKKNIQFNDVLLNWGEDYGRYQ